MLIAADEMETDVANASKTIAENVSLLLGMSPQKTTGSSQKRFDGAIKTQNYKFTNSQIQIFKYHFSQFLSNCIHRRAIFGLRVQTHVSDSKECFVASLSGDCGAKLIDDFLWRRMHVIIGLGRMTAEQV